MASAPSSPCRPARRGRSSWIPALLVCAGVFQGAAAAAGAAPTTALEAGPFLRADLVVLARVREVTDVRAPGGALGRQVVRARVLQGFKGSATRGSEITLMVQGQRPTLDPARPSVPYFRKGRLDRFVLFLARGEGRHAYRLQTLYDAEDRTGEEKIAAVANVAAWSRLRDASQKAAATRDGLLTMLKSRGRWGPGHAARELAYLAQQRPEVFDRRTTTVLTRMSAMGSDADQRFWLRRTLEVLRQVRSEAARQGEAARHTDPWRGAFEQAPGPEDRRLLLGRLLQTGGEAFARHAWWAWNRLEPSSRRWFVEALVLAGARDSLARLREVYGAVTDVDVRTAIVRAVGRLGSDEDTTWLVARRRNETVARAATIALARVALRGGVRARTVLEAARDFSTGDEARWLAYLLGPAFAASERRAGH